MHCVITFMVNGQNFRFWRVGWVLALSALVVRIIRVLFGSIWEYRPHSVRSTMCHVTRPSKTRLWKKLGIVFHGTASLQIIALCVTLGCVRKFTWTKITQVQCYCGYFTTGERLHNDKVSRRQHLYRLFHVKTWACSILSCYVTSRMCSNKNSVIN